MYLLAAILALDCVVLASIPHAASLLGPLAPFGIVSFAVFIGLGYTRLKAQQEELPFNRWFLAAHLAVVACVCTANLAALHALTFLQISHAAHLILRAALLLGIVFLGLACIPLSAWIKTIRVTSPAWLYAALAGVLAWCLRYPMQSFWDASGSAPGRLLQIIAFRCVQAVLRFFLPDVIVNADAFTVGTPRFTIIIAEACSGMEGLGLVLVFTIVWLWYFRRESRFPQALLLVPCALACVWTLNILRISALVFIGNAGAPDIAMVGFHSQAGWIAFTTVAFAFSMATRKLRWVRRIPSYSASMGTSILAGSGSIAVTDPRTSSVTSEEADDKTGESPATGAYLLPFLAILGASFISKAASGSFEWLYPLRFVAAAIALWYSRHELKKLNWRFGWLAPLTGAAVFLVWIVPSLLLGSPSQHTSALGDSLASMSPLARLSWLAFRVAAAVITVPIAEELAFRGYLSRRLVKREFDTVPFSSLTILSIGISSIAFGLMHGQQWLVGIVAGLAYAAVVKWKGRVGDAVIAHATSNLLLAVWVLTRGDWSQW